MKRGKISELSSIEFTDGSLGEAFKQYADALAELSRLWTFELGVAATDSRAAMESLKGHMLLFGLDSKVRARRVAKRLQRAQELAHGLADQGEKFHRAYRRQFLGPARDRADGSEGIEGVVLPDRIREPGGEVILGGVLPAPAVRYWVEVVQDD